MSIQSEIDRLQAAKSAIAAALQTMGVEPPQGTTLDQYAAQLTAIAASAPWLPLAGGTMTGNLDMGGRGIQNVQGIGAVDSKPIDVSGRLNLTSGLSSDGGVGIDFGGDRLQGVNPPEEDTDAANKEYVDGLVGDINSVLDAINGEVV